MATYDEDVKEVKEETTEEAPKEYMERKRWLLFGLPWTFTKYFLRPDMLTIRTGFFKIEENDCYMYKVQDVKLTATFMERLAGLSTITCFTGDTTDPTLELKHIKRGREIKNYLLKESEAARIRRRTVNMLDIGTGDLSDLDNL
jgi:uncharacterized membrane protein YdbT with pleckstrin-like domain